MHIPLEPIARIVPAGYLDEDAAHPGLSAEEPRAMAEMRRVISQAEIADAVGLSKVHVNGLLRDLGRRVIRPSVQVSARW